MAADDERDQAAQASAADRGGADTDHGSAPRGGLVEGFPPSVILLISAASLVAVVFGMKYAAAFIVPVLLGLLITLAFYPLLDRLIKWRVPPMIALLITVVVAVVICVAVVAFMAASLANVARTLPGYADELASIKKDVVGWLNSTGLDVNALAGKASLDPSKIINLITDFVNSFIGVVSAGSFIALCAFFMLLEATTISTKFNRSPHLPSALLQRLGELTRDMRTYVVVTVWFGGGVGIANALFLWALGVPYAGLWGLFSFFMGFIPNIGFVIALIPPTLMALLAFGWERAVIVVIGYIAINGVSDNLLKPKVMGQATNLSMLTVFLSVLFWGWVLGPMGGLLAVPLTLVTKKLFLDPYDEAAWVADVMAPYSLRTLRMESRQKRKRIDAGGASGDR